MVVLLPAHAGMDQPGTGCSAKGGAASRARGDGPAARHAGQRLGDCFPRTRGWSRTDNAECDAEALLPAHAGMDPGLARGPGAQPSASRARGDGPRVRRILIRLCCCFPRTRGWTQGLRRVLAVVALLPAHAGMDPPPYDSARRPSTASRARGMDPRSPRRSTPAVTAPRARVPPPSSARFSTHHSPARSRDPDAPRGTRIHTPCTPLSKKALRAAAHNRPHVLPLPPPAGPCTLRRACGDVSWERGTGAGARRG